MSEWSFLALGDLLRIKHGFAFPGAQFSDDTSLPTLVTPGNFVVGGGFREAKVKTFRGDFPAEYEMSAGDLIVTMTDLSKEGDTLGLPALVPDTGRYLHNQRVGLVEILDSERADAQFLSFFLRTDDYRSYVLGSATGSTVRHTSPTRICSYVAHLPPLHEQHAIAEVLGALDDKIAANSRVATTASLLQTAEFMRLMSGAGVPSTIRNVLTFEYGKPLLAQNRTTGNVDVFGSGGIVGSHNEALASGPGVVVGRKGTAGAVHWAPEDYYPIDTTFFVVSSDIEIYSMIFCYHLLKSVRLSKQNSDSAVPGLNRNDAHAIKIRLPDKESIRQFTLAAMPQANLAAQCDRESLVLAATRDALLPQLMSGKLRVRDAEKSLAGVL